jgi:ABC-type dipeptide/oligopeptide/nickel transport system permease component
MMTILEMMMTTASFSQGRVDTSYRVSEIGSIATLLLLLGRALHLTTPLLAVSYLILIGSIIILFRNRRHDEYLEKHWNAGASTAFFAICLWGVLAPLLMGVFDGLTGRPHAGAEAYEVMANGILPIAFVAFFGAFQISRWRNA